MKLKNILNTFDLFNYSCYHENKGISIIESRKQFISGKHKSKMFSVFIYN